MRKIVNRLPYVISLILALFSAFIVSATSYFSYDDRSPYLSYTSSNRYYLQNAYDGTVSRISYGNSISFTMYGDELYIYACTNTNSVRASVYVDGFIIGYTDNIGVSADLGNPQLVFTKIDLGPGKHMVSIVGSTQYYQANYSGYFYLDRIEVSKSFETDNIYKIYVLIPLYIALGIMIIYMSIKFVLWRLTKRDE